MDLVAEMAVFNPFDFFLEPEAEQYPFVYEPRIAKELEPYLELEPVGPLLGVWLATLDRGPVPTVDFLVELNRRLHQDMAYVIRMEPGVQTCEETLSTQCGSCRDSAWLLVQILRNLGFAARFVSGYLIQLKADVAALDGPSGTDKDFTDLHAWARSTCRVPVGSDSIRRPGCSPARATFRSPARRISAAQRRSRAPRRG